MKRHLALLLFALLPCLAHAQGTVTFTASQLKMGGGSAAVGTGAQLCVMTVDANNRPAGYRIGAAGQTIAVTGGRECHAITAGAIQPFQVINSNNSSPKNACIRVTIEAANGTVLRTDPCVQTGTPDSFANGFCTQVSNTVTCNYDNYASGTAAVSLMIEGPPGRDGATGCVIGVSCTANLTPQSINKILYADAFSGVDLSARITAALASLGGSAASPIERATVYATPGQSYSTSPIVLPNATTAPYVSHTDLHFIGNTVTPLSAGAPLIHVLAQNGNGGAPGTRIDGGIFNAPGTAGVPTIQVDSNIGFEASNNIFNGGLPIKFVNTYFQIPGLAGYNEQWYLHGNDFIYPTGPSVEFAPGTGGSNSALYGIGDKTNHFQFTCGQSAYQVDAGIEIQGGELSGHVNTGPAPAPATVCPSTSPIVLINASGNIYRNTVSRFFGEDTGNTGQVYMFGGPADVTITDLGVGVTGLNLTAPGASTFSHLTLPYNVCTTVLGSQSCATVQDEGHGTGFVLSRKSLVEIGQQFRMWIGAEPGSASHAVYFLPNYNDRPSTATAIRSVYRASGSGTGFGPGFSEKTAGGTCLDATGCHDPADVVDTTSFTVRNPAVWANNAHGGFDSGTGDYNVLLYAPNATAGQPGKFMCLGGYDNTGSIAYATRCGLKMRWEAGYWNAYLTGSLVTAPSTLNTGGSCTDTNGLVHPINSIWADDNYLYHCTTGNQSKRVALAGF